ncbi:MAG: 2,3-bisphosphoglycerate-independent phosphoglycerate mutase, partial [Candidatus Gastranaerophilaceae bacterium]
MTNRVLLCIMDGFGINSNCSKDATKTANTPNLDELKKTVSNITINASGEYVGLPDGQMGNSEVGHLNLGAGRVVYQELSRINNAVKDGSFFKNEALLNAVKHAKENNSSIHFWGLVSSGGVHSAMEHLEALIDLAAKEGLKKVYVHAFLDGRDTPPKSAKTFLERIENKLKSHNLPQIATVSGRYYAMDRDNRWDRVQKAYNCLLL